MSTHSREVQTGHSESASRPKGDYKGFAESAAQSANSLEELTKALLDSRSKGDKSAGNTLDLSGDIFKISSEGGGEQPKKPTPEQLGQMAKGKELLKSGDFEGLCKLAKEIGKDDNDNALGAFQKLLSKEMKMGISFNSAGTSVEITFGDHDPHAKDKIEPYTRVKFKADGSTSAKEFSGRPVDEGKDVDPKAPLEALKKRIEKNAENN